MKLVLVRPGSGHDVYWISYYSA